MIFPTTVDEYIEIMRRRAGISTRELAKRIGWPPGTLSSYVHRLRAGRPPERPELDAIAGGLTDPRSPLASKVVILRYLHALGGIPPTAEEISEFVAFNFPHTPDDPAPSFCYDTRSFVPWVSPMFVTVAEALGGPPADYNTSRLHSWVLADESGDPPERLAVPALCRNAPALFRLDPDAVLDAWDDLTFRAVHMLELWADPDLGASILFDADAEGNLSEEGLENMAHDVRIMEVLHPRFRRSPWFGRIDRRLSRFEGYREGLRRAAKQADEPLESPPLYLATDLTSTTKGLMISSAAFVLLDPRLMMQQVLPADPTVWQSWQKPG